MADPYGDNTYSRLNPPYWKFKDGENEKKNSGPVSGSEKTSSDFTSTARRYRSRGARSSDPQERRTENKKSIDSQIYLSQWIGGLGSRWEKVHDGFENEKSSERMSELNQIKKIRIRRRTTECNPNQEAEEGAENSTAKEEERKKETALIKKLRRRRRTIECNPYTVAPVDDHYQEPEDTDSMLKELKEVRRLRASRRLEYNPYRNRENEEDSRRDSVVFKELNQVRRLRDEQKNKDRIFVDKKESKEVKVEEQKKELQEVKKTRRRSRFIVFDPKELVKETDVATPKRTLKGQEKRNRMSPGAGEKLSSVAKETGSHNSKGVSSRGLQPTEDIHQNSVLSSDVGLDLSSKPDICSNRTETTDTVLKSSLPLGICLTPSEESSAKPDPSQPIKIVFVPNSDESSMSQGLNQDNPSEITLKKDGSLDLDVDLSKTHDNQQEKGKFVQNADHDTSDLTSTPKVTLTAEVMSTPEVTPTSEAPENTFDSNVLQDAANATRPDTVKKEFEVTREPEPEVSVEGSTQVASDKDIHETVGIELACTEDAEEDVALNTKDKAKSITVVLLTSEVEKDGGSIPESTKVAVVLEKQQDVEQTSFETGKLDETKLSDTISFCAETILNPDTTKTVEENLDTENELGENVPSNVEPKEEVSVATGNEETGTRDGALVAKKDEVEEEQSGSPEKSFAEEELAQFWKEQIVTDYRIKHDEPMSCLNMDTEEKNRPTFQQNLSTDKVNEKSVQSESSEKDVPENSERRMSETVLEHIDEQGVTHQDVVMYLGPVWDLFANMKEKETSDTIVFTNCKKGFSEGSECKEAFRSIQGTELSLLDKAEQKKTMGSFAGISESYKSEPAPSVVEENEAKQVEQMSPHLSKKSRDLLTQDEEQGRIPERHAGMSEQITTSSREDTARTTSLNNKKFNEPVQDIKGEVNSLKSLTNLASKVVDKQGRHTQKQRQNTQKHKSSKVTQSELLKQTAKYNQQEEKANKKEVSLDSTDLENKDKGEEAAVSLEKARLDVDDQEQTKKDVFEDADIELIDEGRQSSRNNEQQAYEGGTVKLEDFLRAESGYMAKIGVGTENRAKIQITMTNFGENTDTASAQETKPSKDIVVVHPYMSETPLAPVDESRTRDKVKKRNRKLDIIVGISVFMIYAISLAVYMFYDKLFPVPEPEPAPEPEVNPFWNFVEILFPSAK